MVDPIGRPIVGFRRRLLDDPSKIESVCQKCGAVIVGSVLRGLPELEAEHFVECRSNPQREKPTVPFSAEG